MKLQDVTSNRQFEYGDCDAEVYRLAKEAITHNIDIIIIRGLAWIPKLGEPEEEDAHSWIEINGKTLDPTINQFDSSISWLKSKGITTSRIDIQYQKIKEYSPKEFIEEFDRNWGNQHYKRYWGNKHG